MPKPSSNQNMFPWIGLLAIHEGYLYVVRWTLSHGSLHIWISFLRQCIIPSGILGACSNLGDHWIHLSSGHCVILAGLVRFMTNTQINAALYLRHRGVQQTKQPRLAKPTLRVRHGRLGPHPRHPRIRLTLRTPVSHR